MNKLQRQFISVCLDSIDIIISDQEKLKAAILIYTQDNTNNSRYQLDSKITDAKSWLPQEKIAISSAVFEAVAHNSYKFCSKDIYIKVIEEATTLLLNKYLPLITEHTQSKDRLSSVKKNISQIRLQIDQEIETKMNEEQEVYSIKNNPFIFFSAVTAVVVGVAAVSALSLTQ
ncbi:hypothetical protein TUM19329_07670 [Legionella antarctica]|uniref:Uncharacterized protein n=1 Tax=Legionella antarctica TaxID=2708020 RepID=A0A6F8T366_9GAMM|nr:hypothetical protein [Legionella antarctica]BCA94406.1 hypothetical protein TUM19329_07670 [Legionella antarctica]